MCLAAEFDWTWAIDDLEPFCTQAGRGRVESDQNGALMRTNLHVGRPEADMFGRHPRMDWISIYVTDLAEGRHAHDSGSPVAGRRVHGLDVALTALLGTATSAEPGPEAALRWDLAKAVITLNLDPSAIYLELKRPKYQAWVDEPEPEY